MPLLSYISSKAQLLIHRPTVAPILPATPILSLSDSVSSSSRFLHLLNFGLLYSPLIDPSFLFVFKFLCLILLLTSTLPVGLWLFPISNKHFKQVSKMDDFHFSISAKCIFHWTRAHSWMHWVYWNPSPKVILLQSLNQLIFIAILLIKMWHYAISPLTILQLFHIKSKDSVSLQLQ
jgi:hypothetical protein